MNTTVLDKLWCGIGRRSWRLSSSLAIDERPDRKCSLVS